MGLGHLNRFFFTVILLLAFAVPLSLDASAASLRDAIQTLVAEFPQETMLVRADTQAPTGSTIAVIDMGYAMGLADVRLGALRSE